MRTPASAKKFPAKERSISHGLGPADQKPQQVQPLPQNNVLHRVATAFLGDSPTYLQPEVRTGRRMHMLSVCPGVPPFFLIPLKLPHISVRGTSLKAQVEPSSSGLRCLSDHPVMPITL